jgi:hypothetical protein
MFYAAVSLDSCLMVDQAIGLKMVAVQASETLVDLYQPTRRYNPDDGHLRNHSRDNLK